MLKKYWLLTEIFKLQLRVTLLAFLEAEKSDVSIYELWVLIHTVFSSVEPFCLRQKIKIFNTSLTWLDSAGISIFFTILKRQS